MDRGLLPGPLPNRRPPHRLIVEERPTRSFLHAVQEGITNGRAWLADRKSGYFARGIKDGDFPSGEKLGWMDDKGIYLLPQTAYKFASQALDRLGGLHVTDRALHSLLAKEGILLTKPGDPDHLLTFHRCESIGQRVLWLQPDALDAAESPIEPENE